MKTLFIDMDGVIVNFINGALAAHGWPITHEQWDCFHKYADLGMSSEEFWAPLKGREFWRGLHPYPGAMRFLEYLRLNHPEFRFLTSPSDDHECYLGKLDWVKNFLAVNPLDYVIPCRDKSVMACSNILIDDAHHHEQGWRSNGGLFLGFKQPWNNYRHNYRSIIETLEDVV